MNVNKAPKNDRFNLKRDKAPSTIKHENLKIGNDGEDDYEEIINTNSNSNAISPRRKVEEINKQNLLNDPMFEAVLSAEEKKLLNEETMQQQNSLAYPSDKNQF